MIQMAGWPQRHPLIRSRSRTPNLHAIDSGPSRPYGLRPQPGQTRFHHPTWLSRGYLGSRNITLLIGQRQSGKTTRTPFLLDFSLTPGWQANSLGDNQRHRRPANLPWPPVHVADTFLNFSVIFGAKFLNSLKMEGRQGYQGPEPARIRNCQNEPAYGHWRVCPYKCSARIGVEVFTIVDSP